MEIGIIDIDFGVTSLLIALWIMIPAYIPNPVAAVVGGGKPIDLGRNWYDGRRILGDGKTYRGFFGGVLAGVAIGLVMLALESMWGVSIHTLLSIVLLATGALLGDMVESFFKRRLNKKRGEQWLIADQYDLVAGAFVMVALFDLPWLLEHVTPGVALWIIILTPVLHRAVNIIGYLAGVKDVPW